MKTTLTTPTFTITLTEIKPDYNDPSNFELDFETTLSRAYLETIFDAETLNYVLDTDDDITYELNVAHRHNSCIYFIAKHDRSGDYYDDYDAAVYAFGQPVIDFIADACRILNVPFYAA